MKPTNPRGKYLWQTGLKTRSLESLSTKSPFEMTNSVPVMCCGLFKGQVHLSSDRKSWCRYGWERKVWCVRWGLYSLIKNTVCEYVISINRVRCGSFIIESRSTTCSSMRARESLWENVMLYVVLLSAFWQANQRPSVKAAAVCTKNSKISSTRTHKKLLSMSMVADAHVSHAWWWISIKK